MSPVFVIGTVLPKSPDNADHHEECHSHDDVEKYMLVEGDFKKGC
jgi:hypothetical protein